MVPLTTIGYDCCPFLIPGTALLRSNVKARPSCETLPGVICVRGEYRFSFGVLPKSTQFTDAPAVVAAEPEFRKTSARAPATPTRRPSAHRPDTI